VKLDRALRSITALIVRCCDPDAVLLFGSHAKGQYNLDSDLDLLVIGDFQGSPYLRGHEVRGLLRRYPIRIDLHLVTQEEVAAESRKPHGFLSAALSSSRILYEKAGAGH
jgi:predicted nucleotidyltransferase